MYVRVVRFTDVNAERMEGLLARIKESTDASRRAHHGLDDAVRRGRGHRCGPATLRNGGGHERGRPSVERDGRLRDPGTRASVDTCELKLELKA